MEAVVMSFCGLCLLLVLGKLIRTAVPLLQRLYLPASVIGGILGLVWLNTPLGREASPDWHLNWNALPGFLINIVFASLFIGSTIPKFKTVWNEAAPQLCMGQLIAWGQYVTGLGLALVVLVPLFGVNVAFGNLLEIGFEGGHGTVAGLAGTFRDFGWPEGIALGYTVATVGMVLGIILGMAMINLAVRRGWIRNIRTFEEQSTPERIGIYPKDERPHAGLQTVRSDSIDSLALHIAVIGLAVMIGYGLQRLLAFANIYMPSGIQDLKVLTSFPLFPLCLIGGLILQKFLMMIRLDSMVSHGQIQRLGGAALDCRVVSAVASIRLDFVVTYWMPLLLLVLGGVVWSMAMVLYVAPRLFRDAWFERAIAEFGQSLGVTATGLLLLRTVDPENKTAAAASFGYKQLLHEPIMGGGIWTSLALVLVFTKGIGMVWLISIGMVVFWLLFWQFVLKRSYAKAEETSE